MSLRDILILARTKRKNHRIRTWVVTIISSLLFVVLFLVALVLQGVVSATHSYGSVGWNEHFLTTIMNGFDPTQSDDLQKQAENSVIADLQARKITVTDSLKNGAEFQSEVAKRVDQLMQQARNDTQTGYEKNAHSHHASALYHLVEIPNNDGLQRQTSDDADPSRTLIQKNAEQKKPASTDSQMNDASMPPQLATVEDALVREQLSSQQTMQWAPGQPYPLFIPYDYLLTLSGKSLSGLKSADVIATYRSLVNEYRGKEIDFCYRNAAALSQLQQATIYNQQLIANKSHDRPVALPTCQNLDQAALKKAGLLESQNAVNPDGSKPLFPPSVDAPITQQLRFRIVGYLPFSVPNAEVAPNILDLFFLTVSLPPNGVLPLIVPQSVLSHDQSLQAIFNDKSSPATRSLIVDFADRATQKEFIAANTCMSFTCDFTKQPVVTPFGSMTVATESIVEESAGFGNTVTIISGIMAGIIIMLSIGKVVADSSREIAIFRGIGASRLNIIQIYGTYGFLVALNALILAFLIALAIALTLSANFAGQVNEALTRTMGAYDTTISVSLVDFNWQWLGNIVLTLLIATGIGIAIPTVRAVRGQLSSRMREE